MGRHSVAARIPEACMLELLTHQLEARRLQHMSGDRLMASMLYPESGSHRRLLVSNQPWWAVGPDGDIYFTSDDGVQGLYRLRRLS